MTRCADPPKNAMPAAEAARIVAEAGGPGMIWIDAKVTGDPFPGATGRIAAALFPWLSGPAKPDPEAEP